MEWNFVWQTDGIHLLKLSDRIFKCACGYIEDRDFNAALNLRDAMTYEVA